MIYSLVRELAAEKIPVAVTCGCWASPKQAFYKWRANPVSQRDWDDAHLINAAYDIHYPAFGYRIIADELREQGHRVGENRVARLAPSSGSGRCSPRSAVSTASRPAGARRPGRPPVH